MRMVLLALEHLVVIQYELNKTALKDYWSWVVLFIFYFLDSWFWKHTNSETCRYIKHNCFDPHECIHLATEFLNLFHSSNNCPRRLYVSIHCTEFSVEYVITIPTPGPYAMYRMLSCVHFNVNNVTIEELLTKILQLLYLQSTWQSSPSRWALMLHWN